MYVETLYNPVVDLGLFAQGWGGGGGEAALWADMPPPPKKKKKRVLNFQENVLT